MALPFFMACTQNQKAQSSKEGTALESSVDASAYYGTTKPKHGVDEIWINNREEPQHLDPILTHGVPDGNLAMNSFSRLVQIDPTTSKPIPDLAQSWEAFDKGSRYVFKLKQGLKWSDGKPLTAHDFEYSWKRLIDPKTGAVYASLAYSTIAGGEAFARRALKVTGFKSKNEHQQFQADLKKSGITQIEKFESSYSGNDLFVFFEQENKDSQKGLLVKSLQGMGGLKAQETTPDDVQVRATDDLTLEVSLVGPLPYFVLLAEFSSFAAIPKHVVEKVASENNGDASRWTRPENIVVSGAYKLIKENFKIDKIYEKNPLYWDASNVKTKRIVVKMIETENAVMNAYKVGEVDWIGPHEVPAEQLKTVQDFKDFYNDPYLGVYYYIVNQEIPAFQDVRVRRALSLSIDRASITQNILAGAYIPYGGLVPDGLAGYKSYQQELYNPEKAKALLAEAGYPDGKGFPKFKFKYDTKDIHRLIIQAVQQMWKKTLNIDVEMVNVEWKVYLDDMQSHRFEMSRSGWIGDFLDPFTFHELMLSNSGNNHPLWKNKKYDQLVLGANELSDEAQRFQMLYEAEKIAVEDVARIPIYLYTKTYMLKPFIKGFYKDYQDHHLWKHMWVDPNWSQGQ